MDDLVDNHGGIKSVFGGKFLSDSTDAAEARSRLESIRNFIARSDVVDNGSDIRTRASRFGILSELIKSVPIHLYDHPEICQKYETAFMDGRAIYFNLHFFNDLRKDELENGSHNVVPVILHELLHFAMRHTQRESLNALVNNDFEAYLMNLAKDSLINGIIYNDFSKYGEVAKARKGFMHHTNQISLGKSFMGMCIGIGDKECEAVYGKSKKEVLLSVFGEESIEYNKAPEKMTKKERKEHEDSKAATDAIKDLIENDPMQKKMKELMEKTYEFLHWENTRNMTEYEVFIHIRDIFEKDEEFKKLREEHESGNESSQEGEPGSKLRGSSPGGNSQESEPGNGSPGQPGSGKSGKGELTEDKKKSLMDKLKEVVKSIGEDFEAGEHEVSARQLRKDLEQAGLSEDADKMRLPKTEGEEEARLKGGEGDVQRALEDFTNENSDPSLSPGNSAGMIKQRIQLKGRPALDYEGELIAMLDYVAGNAERMTNDDMPGVEWYLDYESMGMDMPFYEEGMQPGNATGVVMVLVDTSGSVSDDMLGQFATDIDAMAHYLEPSGAKIIVLDADVQVSAIKEILPGEAGKLHKDGMLFNGRGGTDFQSALFQAGELIRTKYNPETQGSEREEVAAIIYLTDGEDHAPSVLPHESLPDNISFVVPESQVQRLDNIVKGYAKVLGMNNKQRSVLNWNDVTVTKEAREEASMSM